MPPQLFLRRPPWFYRLLACFVCGVLMASVLNITYLHKLQFFYTIIWVFRCSGDFRFYGGHEKPEYKRWIKTGLIWLTLKLTSFFWQNGSEEAVGMHSFWSTSSFLFVRYKRGHWIQTLIGPPHFVASIRLRSTPLVTHESHVTLRD